MNKDFEKIDNILFKYFQEDTYVPSIISDGIQDALNRKKKEKKLTILIKKIIIALTSIITVTGGIVFADDIKEFITSLFINSTESIDIAVDNGYIQQSDEKYCYDNNIGIKIENITIDDFNLAISFLYDVSKLDIDSLNSIGIFEYEMTADENIFLYKYDSQNSISSKIPTINSVKKLNPSQQINENTFKESIIYSANQFNTFNNINIKINSLKINNNIINGNWNLSIKLDEKFNNRNNIIYTVVNNEHVLDSNITMSETSLNIYIKLDEKYLYQKNDILEINPIIIDKSGKKYNYSNYEPINLDNASEYNIKFNISKYSENIDTLYLNLNLSSTKTISLELNKK